MSLLWCDDNNQTYTISLPNCVTVSKQEETQEGMNEQLRIAAFKTLLENAYQECKETDTDWSFSKQKPIVDCFDMVITTEKRDKTQVLHWYFKSSVPSGHTIKIQLSYKDGKISKKVSLICGESYSVQSRCYDVVNRVGSWSEWKDTSTFATLAQAQQEKNMRSVHTEHRILKTTVEQIE